MVSAYYAQLSLQDQQLGKFCGGGDATHSGLGRQNADVSWLLSCTFQAISCLGGEHTAALHTYAMIVSNDVSKFAWSYRSSTASRYGRTAASIRPLSVSDLPKHLATMREHFKRAWSRYDMSELPSPTEVAEGLCE